MNNITDCICNKCERYISNFERYKCEICDNFDYCENCYINNNTHEHTFIKYSLLFESDETIRNKVLAKYGNKEMNIMPIGNYVKLNEDKNIDKAKIKGYIHFFKYIINNIYKTFKLNKNIMKYNDVMPFRLWDVIQQKVILTEKNKNYKYITISYPWNNNEEKTHNVDGISWAVSKSIRKAISKIEKIKSNINYLWIDQICIDQENHIEKEIEIQKMGIIYKNTECCLIYVNKIGEPVTIDEIVDSKWLNRAWVVQEYILSNSFFVTINKNDSKINLISDEYIYNWVLNYLNNNILEVFIDKIDKYANLFELLYIKTTYTIDPALLILKCLGRESTIVLDKIYSSSGILLLYYDIKLNINYKLTYDEALNNLLKVLPNNIIISLMCNKRFTVPKLDGIHSMPGYTKFTNIYSESIFNFPKSILYENNIMLITNCKLINVKEFFNKFPVSWFTDEQAHLFVKFNKMVEESIYLQDISILGSQYIKFFPKYFLNGKINKPNSNSDIINVVEKNIKQKYKYFDVIAKNGVVTGTTNIEHDNRIPEIIKMDGKDINKLWIVQIGYNNFENRSHCLICYETDYNKNSDFTKLRSIWRVDDIINMYDTELKKIIIE